LSIKGSKGQIEDVMFKGEKGNDQVGFKCLKYSVTESAGTVEVTLVKKTSAEIKVGLQTSDGTATKDKEYKEFN